MCGALDIDEQDMLLEALLGVMYANITAHVDRQDISEASVISALYCVCTRKRCPDSHFPADIFCLKGLGHLIPLMDFFQNTQKIVVSHWGRLVVKKKKNHFQQTHFQLETIKHQPQCCATCYQSPGAINAPVEEE